MESVGADKRAVNPSGLAFLPAQSVEGLKAAGDILRVTCFLTSLDGLQQARSAVAAAFPAAAFPAAATNFVQLTRFGGEPATTCEAVARGSAARPNGTVVFTGTKIVFSGLQMAFRDQEADVRLAFDRLKKAVEPLGGRLDAAVFSIYAVTRPAAEAANRVLGGGVPMVFEGLPSLDATVGIDVVAAGVP
jgi:hypothetical protein